MQIKLGSFTARLAESGWLAALVLVPVFFNVYSERVFEEDKIPLLRSIALAVWFSLVVWALESSRQKLRTEAMPLWRIPLLTPALILALAYLVATLFSIVPHTSFFGAYLRLQGTYTFLSYLGVFFAMILLVRRPDQVDRIVNASLLGSLVPALYGAIQKAGRDPIPWSTDFSGRVPSTFGQPIFAAALMIMIVPVTLARLIDHIGRLRLSRGHGSPHPSAAFSVLLAGACLFLLVLQLVMVIYAQSRGPFVGLLVGLGVFFSLLALTRQLRWLKRTLAVLGCAGTIFLILFNLPQSSLEPLREMRYVGRLGRIFDAKEGSGRSRVVIWEGVTRLLAESPRRYLTGYGPESMPVAYSRFVPVEFSYIETTNASIDRAHNETFDLLITTGVVGFAAYTAFVLLFFYHGLSWLGLILSSAQRTAFWGMVVMGGVAGGIAPYFLDGSLRFSGVGFPAGILLGLIGYLATSAGVESGGQRAARRSSDLLLIGLVSAAVAHYVEIQLGIAIAATRLYFWVYAALAVAIGLPLVQEEHASTNSVAQVSTGAGRTQTRRKNRESESIWDQPRDGYASNLGILAACVLLALSFSFYQFVSFRSGTGGAVLYLLSGIWLLGAMLAAAGPIENLSIGAYGFRRLGFYSAASLGPWLVFVLAYSAWLAWSPGASSGGVERLKAGGAHFAGTVSVFYLSALALMIVGAVELRREKEASRALSIAWGWRSASYLVLLAGAVFAIVRSNLNVSQADVYSKQASSYERSQQWDAAYLLYAEAARIQPRQDRYYLNMGRVQVEKARGLRGDAGRQKACFQQALAAGERALEVNPLDPEHSRNLATLHRIWAGSLDDARERQHHYVEANRYFEQAIRLDPRNAGIWNAWAVLHLERNEVEKALAKLEHSLELDRRFPETYLLRGRAYLRSQDYRKALADYESVLLLDPASRAALDGKAYALSQLKIGQD